MKEKQVCPYCKRKVKYLKRLLEHNNGEHKCPHCNKISNITQDKKMWTLLFVTIGVAALIMLFYFIASGPVTEAYNTEGSYKFLMAVFFGKSKEIKWLIYEMIPFIIFYFISPVFMEFSPQKRYMDYTTTSIDLNVPKMPKNDRKASKADGSTKTISVTGSEFSGVYEDISSSSSDAMGKTRAFDVNSLTSDTTNINTEKNSTSGYYRDNTPLKRVKKEISE